MKCCDVEVVEALIGEIPKPGEHAARIKYRAVEAKLKSIPGIEAVKVIENGVDMILLTPQGKRAYWTRNNGMEERSRYCGSLRIDDKTIFTSGAVARAMKYILES
jgi:hypothetical protein